MYIPYLINQALMWLTGVNCAQFVVAPLLIFCGFYSYHFLFRILRDVLGCQSIDATLTSLLLFSFAFVMLSTLVPDHFVISMFLLLLTLYVSGRHIQAKKGLSAGATILLFIATAGVSLNNGLKTFLSALFCNGRRFFRPAYLLGAVLLPAVLMWGFCRFEYKQFVWPGEQARHAAKAAKMRAKKEAKKQEAMAVVTKKDVAKDTVAEKKTPAQPTEKKKKTSKLGTPFAKGEFMRWTDKSTPRWESIVENLFGESIQLHTDYLLKDEMRSRPMIVHYRWTANYVVEGLLVLLFVLGIVCSLRNRFMLLALSFFLLDMLLHIVLGFGINEVYIMSAHWIYVIPLAIGFLLSRLAAGPRMALRVVVGLLATGLYAYNLTLLCSHFL